MFPTKCRRNQGGRLVGAIQGLRYRVCERRSLGRLRARFSPSICSSSGNEQPGNRTRRLFFHSSFFVIVMVKSVLFLDFAVTSKLRCRSK